MTCFAFINRPASFALLAGWQLGILFPTIWCSCLLVTCWPYLYQCVWYKMEKMASAM